MSTNLPIVIESPNRYPVASALSLYGAKKAFKLFSNSSTLSAGTSSILLREIQIEPVNYRPINYRPLPKKLRQKASEFDVGDTSQGFVNFCPFNRIGRVKRSLSMFVAQIFHYNMRLRQCKIAVFYRRYCSLKWLNFRIHAKGLLYLGIDFQVPFFFLFIFHQVNLFEIVFHAE